MTTCCVNAVCRKYSCPVLTRLTIPGTLEKNEPQSIMVINLPGGGFDGRHHYIQGIDFDLGGFKVQVR